MNIDKIIREFPRAWKECMLFLGYSEDDQAMFIDTPYIDNRGSVILHNGEFNDFGFHYRRLYDYFDSVGILILIEYDDIRDWKVRVNNWSKYQENRTEAEYLGFGKGFEFRENKLRQHTDGINSDTVS